MTTTHWLRIAAVAFAASYAGALFTASLPEGAYDNDRVVGLLSGGELTGIVIGGYCLVVAGISAIAFTSLLAGAVSRAGSAGASMIRSLGTAYGVMLMVAAALFLAVPMGHVVGELPDATPSPFRELTMAGFVALLVAALLCAGVVVVIASALIRRRGLAPGWVTTTGFVVAPLLLVGATWAPQFLVPLWALLVGITLRPEPHAGPAAVEPRFAADLSRSDE